jgi:hypothetical protein
VTQHSGRWTTRSPFLPADRLRPRSQICLPVSTTGGQVYRTTYEHEQNSARTFMFCMYKHYKELNEKLVELQLVALDIKLTRDLARKEKVGGFAGSNQDLPLPCFPHRCRPRGCLR